MSPGVFCDLTHKRFGRLIVLKRLPNIKGKVIYECLCDCSNVVQVRADSLAYKKKNNTRSCGCLQKEAARKTGKLSRKAPGLKLKKDLFSNYKRAAKHRDIEWSLGIDKFEELILSPCYYCDVSNSNKIKHPRIKEDFVLYNGIDRIDSSVGYTVDNAIPCCQNCNYAKLDYSLQEFYDWIGRIFKNLKKKGLISE